MEDTMKESILTKHQKKVKAKCFKEGDHWYVITVTIRYDDECGNGHNTFSITGDIWKSTINGKKIGRDCLTGGCIHDDIIKHFPELKPFIKWHLTSSDGPMYYLENTLFYAEHHGPDRVMVYVSKGNDEEFGLEFQDSCYEDIETANKIKEKYGDKCRLELDKKTAKTADYDAARACAVWPEAKDEEITEANLKKRLPALMEEFVRDVESLGLVF
jgi:hypothetical protein